MADQGSDELLSPFLRIRRLTAAIPYLNGEHLILRVPGEPLLRARNMLRGWHWKSFGNTPGYIQHWTKEGFLSLVSRGFEIPEVVSHFPWTMLMCHSRQ